jgi:predicted metallopeptidase
MEWHLANDIKKDIKDILKVLELPHIKLDRIFCYRTTGSKARAYARTWSFPKIFQSALNIKPAYVIEVLAKYYDKLNPDEQKKVLIHELLHIPKNFSGALLPHHSHYRNMGKLVNELFKEYTLKINSKH